METAKASTPIGISELLGSRLWSQIGPGNYGEFQSAIFQPVGGMEMLAKGFERELGGRQAAEGGFVADQNESS